MIGLVQRSERATEARTSWLSRAVQFARQSLPPGVIPTGAPPEGRPDEPTAELLTGQEMTPTQLLAAIAAFTGAAISRPERYDQHVARYGQVIWVYRAVTINAQNVAAVPFKAYTKSAAKGTDQELTEAPNHPLQLLMDRVNPIMTRYDLWELTSINLDLVGNSYWVVFRDPQGYPAELWPVRPDRMEILGDPTIGVRGYRYRVPRGVFDFGLRDVIHIKYQSPWHDFYGQGALTPALPSVDAYQSMVTWRKFFYDNNATPSAVLQTPEQLSEEQIQQLRELWMSVHAGPRNAGRIAVLQNNMKYEKAGATPRDALIVKDLEMSRQDILASFGVPLEAAGLATGGGLGDSGHHKSAILNYREQTIKPRLEKIEQMINEFLAPQFGPDIECHFDTSDFIREDEAQRSTIDVAEIAAGLVTINEARENRGLKPVKWGDVWWMNATLVPATSPEEAQQRADDQAQAKTDALAANLASKKPPSPDSVPPDEPPTPEEKKELEDMPDTSRAILAGLAQGLQQSGLPVPRKIRGLLPSSVGQPISQPLDLRITTVDTDLDESNAGIWKAYIGRTSPLQREFESHLRGALTRIGRQTAAKVRRLSSAKMAAKRATPNLEELVPIFESIGQDLYPKILEMGWDEGNKRRRIAAKRLKATRKAVDDDEEDDPSAMLDFDLAVPGIRGYLRDRPAQYGKDVSNTTIRYIRGQLEEGVAAGESIDEIADRILEYMDVDSAYRARRIAQTEVISASNAGTVANYRESGVVEEKEWASAGDEKVRDAHADADGQVVGIDEAFDVDGEELDYPGDPNGSAENIINCRCTVLPVTEKTGAPASSNDEETGDEEA